MIILSKTNVQNLRTQGRHIFQGNGEIKQNLEEILSEPDPNGICFDPSVYSYVGTMERVKLWEGEEDDYGDVAGGFLSRRVGTDVQWEGSFHHLLLGSVSLVAVRVHHKASGKEIGSVLTPFKNMEELKAAIQAQLEPAKPVG